MDAQSQSERIASQLLSLLGTGRQSGRYPDLDFAKAYAVGGADPRPAPGTRRAPGRPQDRLHQHHDLGRYGVTGPMWNFIYDSTVHELAEASRRSTSPACRSRASSRRSSAPRRKRRTRAWTSARSSAASTGSRTASRSCSRSTRLDLHRPRGRRRLRPARRPLHRRAPPGRRRPRPLGRPLRSFAIRLEQPRRPGRRRPRQPRPRRTAQRTALPDRRDRPLSHQRPARRRRDHHHRHPDRRAADPSRRHLVDRARRNSDQGI